MNHRIEPLVVGLGFREKRLQQSGFLTAFLPPLPPRIDPERQQDRAYDHHAFHEDAEPGDLGLQQSPIRSGNRSRDRFLVYSEFKGDGHQAAQG